MGMCVTQALVSRKQTCNLPITVIPANRAKPRGEAERVRLSLLEGNFLEFLQQVFIQLFYHLDFA